MEKRKRIMNDEESFSLVFGFSGTILLRNIFSCYIKEETMVMMTMGVVFWCASSVERCVHVK